MDGNEGRKERREGRKKTTLLVEKGRKEAKKLGKKDEKKEGKAIKTEINRQWTSIPLETEVTVPPPPPKQPDVGRHNNLMPPS